jgi:hypothetical protein
MKGVENNLFLSTDNTEKRPGTWQQKEANLKN